ncbi:MAG: Xaa-Pro peptidase family protein [Candidatus Woesearchaeota archaeon]
MRINNLRQKLKLQNIHLAIIVNSTLQDPNFFYFSNISPENGLLVLPLNSPVRLYCSTLECGQLKKRSKIKNFYDYDKKTFEKINNLIRKQKIRKIGLNFSSITVNELKRLKKLFGKGSKELKFVDISDLLRQSRAVKTKEEIKLYSIACNITEQIWDNTLDKIKKKRLKTELHIKDYMENQMKKKHLAPSFPIIVASGRNASIPHYSPQDKKLARGFCVVDFGIKYNGYCTDITRTVFLGKPTDKERKYYSYIYNLVYNAKEHAASLIGLGKKTSLVAKKTSSFLGNYEKYFTHGLGHGIGLEIHELPNLKLKAKGSFMSRMIFTIEPGVYIKNKLGIRIEDDYLLENNKLISLTNAPKELVIIP